MNTKHIFAAIFVIGVLCAPFISGCRRDSVEPGNVGITIPAYGEDKGVTDVQVRTGIVWYNDYTVWYYEFPNHLLTYVWTANTVEESPTNEEFSFTCDGITVLCDMQVNVEPITERIPHIFVRLRQNPDKLKGIREFIRGRVRDAIGLEAGNLKLQELYTTGRERLMIAVKKRLEAEIGMDFKIDAVSIIGALRWPPNIEAAINRTIEAQQATAAAQEKVAQIKAEADQAIEKARGEAEAEKLRAEGVAASNDIITKSLSPMLLADKAVGLWNGALPLYLPGDTGKLPTTLLIPTQPTTAKE